MKEELCLLLYIDISDFFEGFLGSIIYLTRWLRTSSLGARRAKTRFTKKRKVAGADLFAVRNCGLCMGFDSPPLTLPMLPDVNIF